MKSFEQAIQKTAQDLEAREGPFPEVEPPVIEYCKMCRSISKNLTDGHCPDCTRTIERGYQISYKQGRNFNGAHRDAGEINHARMLNDDNVPSWKAVCGTKPGLRSGGWAHYGDDRQVTCKRCLKRLSNH